MPDDKSIIIDPGGELNVRPGVAVTVYPSSYEEKKQSPIAKRTDFGRILTGTQSEFFDLRFEAMVSSSEYQKLLSLHNLVGQKIASGGIPEVLIYNKFSAYSEFLPQSRAHVPDTTVEVSGGLASYQLVMAGIFQMETLQWSSNPIVRITFNESFVVTKSSLYGP